MPISPFPSQPESLAVLYESYLSMCDAVTRPRKSIELRYFEKVLRTETRTFEMNEKGLAHQAEGLAFYWLYLMAQRLGSTKSIDTYTDDINLILKVIIKHNLTRTLVYKHGLASELAFIVGVRIFQTSYGKRHPLHYHIGELLKQWFELTIPEETLTKLDAYVDYVYGEGVWDLYATEVDWPGKIPRHLYNNGIAVNGLLHMRSQLTRQRVINLPQDF